MALPPAGHGGETRRARALAAADVRRCDYLCERVDERDDLVPLECAERLVLGRDEDLERGADPEQLHRQTHHESV